MLTSAPADQQLHLLEIPPAYRLDGNAHARNAYGHLAQEIVWNALDLLPIRINGNYDCCFDAEDKKGRKCEIKSVHRKGKVVLYKFRMEKEREWMGQADNILVYHLLVHNMRKGMATGANLHDTFLTRGVWLCSVGAANVHALAKKYPLQIPNPGPNVKPRCGYSREGYCDGYYNLPIEDLIWEIPNCWKRQIVWHGKSYEYAHFQ